ncbi:hypothetical protein F4814DRAFT_67502 [Daldinia grandis]|nr:hypothetical protein F4814DRAFT_67502 [Daldinia grandis]
MRRPCTSTFIFIFFGLATWIRPESVLECDNSKLYAFRWRNGLRVRSTDYGQVHTYVHASTRICTCLTPDALRVDLGTPAHESECKQFKVGAASTRPRRSASKTITTKYQAPTSLSLFFPS